MSTEQSNLLNNEGLSALMDGEAQEFELRRLLQSYPADPDIRAKWVRYQIASSILRKQSLEANTSTEFADTVQRAIQEEPGFGVSTDSVGRYKVLTRMAVAASVAIAVVTGVQWQQRTATEASQLAAASLRQPANHQQMTPAPSDPVVALTASVFTQPRDKQTQRYIQQHNLENVSLDTARVPLMNAADKRSLNK